MLPAAERRRVRRATMWAQTRRASLLINTSPAIVFYPYYIHHGLQNTTSSPARQASIATTSTKPRRKRTTRSQHDPLKLTVSRPVFARDRWTVVIQHGDPDGDGASIISGVLTEAPGGEEGAHARPVWRREPKRYVVFSDLSEESRWAVEWGIGTVLRDGDEM